MALTAQDLNKIISATQKIVGYAVSELKEELSSQISHLPTKDEFFTMEDKVVGELKKTREEQDLLTYRVSQHTDDITALQDIHPQNKHIAAN